LHPELVEGLIFKYFLKYRKL